MYADIVNGLKMTDKGKITTTTIPKGPLKVKLQQSTTTKRDTTVKGNKQIPAQLAESKGTSSSSAPQARLVTPALGVFQPVSTIQLAKWVMGPSNSSNGVTKAPSPNPQNTYTTKTPSEREYD
ncbi:hypothetical protein FXO37_20889 [Capsicum annuum]|nr:hypothetical protein FXO37_20889 [Capsicum annuum]